MLSVEDVVDFVRSQLSELADPAKAQGMAAYMHGSRWQEVYKGKTEMPFYGVQKPGRVEIMRSIKKHHSPVSQADYLDLATALWELPHREEKYLAQGVATTFKEFIVPDSMPLYLRFITEGAWWDFVDETATHMIRELVLGYPEETWPIVDTWIVSDDMWLRRAAIICQIGAKDRTETGRLFDFCERRMHEPEFFIRKAIGWALREYAKTDAHAVADFVVERRDQLSGLSFREATKHITNMVSG